MNASDSCKIQVLIIRFYLSPFPFQLCPLTLEEKHNMIAEAAFLRFKQRNYPGDPIADWLAAEAELENALSA
jgi:hypothetical protein